MGNPQNHPEYAKYKALVVLGGENNPIETYITNAWRKVFQPGNSYYLPGAFAQYDPVSVADTYNINLQKGFSQICPGFTKGNGWAKNDATADITGLEAQKLSTVEWDGDPVFSDNDNRLTLRLKLNQFVLRGKITVKQVCCSGIFGWCISSGSYSAWEKFILKQNDVRLSFDALVSNDTSKPPTLTVDNTSVTVKGVKMWNSKARCQAGWIG